MEEQISELMDKVWCAADAGYDKLVEAAQAEITKVSNKMDRALASASENRTT